MNNKDKLAGSSGPVGDVGPTGGVGNAGNCGNLAKLSQSGDRDVHSGIRREPTWSHGIGEDALGEAGEPPDIRERIGPARGILLAFVLGLILWGAGIYLIAKYV